LQLKKILKVNMLNLLKPERKELNPFIGIGLLALLFYTSTISYLLFHSLSELISIIIACMIFIISWHSQKYIRNNYLIYISTAYIFVAVLDLLHTLSYPGMSIFQDYDYYANQLWIGARYFESIILLSGFYFLNKEKPLNQKMLLIIFSAVSAVIILSIFKWKVFPICFVEGEGLTPFKKISEYIISIILVCTAFLLYRNRKSFSPNVYRYMLYSIFYTILAELAFTFYISNYGISNLAGHYFKLFSFYCIYRSIIKTGLEEPYEIIFKELADSEKKLSEANTTKNKLFSVLMHDLRGPLSSMNIFLKDVSENFDDYTENELKELLSSGRNSISGLDTMLNNLYTWVTAQSEFIKPQIKELSLLNMVNQAIEPALPAAKQKDIKVSVELDSNLTVKSDEEILKIVIRNIVSNSIKFTEKGGNIKIFCIFIENQTHLVISDTGIGIPEEKINELFSFETRYSRPGTNMEKGSGLGLFMSRDLLSKTGSELKIETEQGKGTSISIIFIH